MNQKKFISDFDKMNIAYSEAVKAFEENEVPVGTASFIENNLIAKNHNRIVKNNNPTGHSEILVLKETAELLKNYRLDNVEIFTTVEPCIMCVGAMIHSRIKRLVFGCQNRKWGFIKSIYNFDEIKFNYKFKITEGIMEKECSVLMKKFFQNKRIGSNSFYQCSQCGVTEKK